MCFFITYNNIFINRMNNTTFTYNNNTYVFHYDSSDPSELWCIDEIVRDNDYLLDKFVGLECKTLFDIGANCGVATIILAKQNPLSTIYSFEPDPRVFHVLKLNTEANNLQNVILFNAAVSKKGIYHLELCIHPQYSGGNTTYSDEKHFHEFFNSTVKTFQVDAKSLDQLIDQYNISEIELLKIDCEGGEYDILYDSIAFTQNKIKNMVGEFHNLRYNNKVNSTAEELIQYSKKYVSGIFAVRILTV